MIQKCPICEGHGLVPFGFYNATAGLQGSTTANTMEACRACGGYGVISEYEKCQK